VLFLPEAVFPAKIHIILYILFSVAWKSLFMLVLLFQRGLNGMGAKLNGIWLRGLCLPAHDEAAFHHAFLRLFFRPRLFIAALVC
jgi:hypothetical protein